MNLFENFDDIINDDFISQLKSQSNDNLGDIEVAVKGVFYTLVAGLIRRTNSDMSAGMLFNQIKEKFKTGVVPEDKTRIFSEKGLLEKISDDGLKIISQIFPAYKSPLLSMISSYAGTSKNTTVITSGLTSSLLIDMLGRKVTSENLDKEGLVYFLKQHHEPLLIKAPEALMEKMIPALGLQELINTKIIAPKKPEPVKNTQEDELVDPISPTATERYVEDEESATFFNKKVLLLLLAVAILGGVGYYFYANNGQFSFLNKDEAPVESLDEELLFADSLANAAKDTVKIDSVVSNDKPEPVGFSEFGSFKQYVLDNTKSRGQEFEFKSIQYLDNTFDLTSESAIAIDSIAQLMNNIKNLQVKITAYSESGDVKLNNKRAFAVKKVLMSKGVNTIRIDAGSGGNGGNFPKIKVITK